jgi:serine/threonine protein kinase
MTEPDHTLDSGKPKSGDELAAGAQLGKYTLERVLGSGGMGVVWQAHDPDLERAIAIKVLRGAEAGPTMRARLLREARAMARLKHPNVLTVYEVGTDGDRDYIAMELVEGTNLDAWLTAKPPRDEVVAAILAAGRGLAAAHAAGLVHRDFKPHNVLRSRDGRVLVTDFGLARGTVSEDAHETSQSATAPTVPGAVGLADTVEATPPTPAATPRPSGLLESTLTQTGALIGTPAYMAPEQFVGAAPDPRTDQFAFCVTAWQALTGERPFRGTTYEQLRRAIADGVDGVPAPLSRGVRAVLARGLAVDPDLRWPDLDSLLAALERALRPRGASRRQLAFAAFGVAAAIILFFRFGTPPSQPPPPPPGARSPLACSSPEEAFGDAWVPAHRVAIASRIGDEVRVRDITDALDRVRQDWLRAYSKTCAAPSSTIAMAQLTCLLGERDQVATFSRLLDTVPPSSFRRMQLWGGNLPRVEACERDSPVSPPLLPEDRKLRDRIVALRVRVALVRLNDPLGFESHVDELLAAARAIGWQPIEAEIYASAGQAATYFHNSAAAADYEKAIELAEQHHDLGLVASARIGLLRVETQTSPQPGERDREQRLEKAARDAVERAGDDPALQLAIEQEVAVRDLGLHRSTEAFERAERARKRLLDLHGTLEALGAASTAIAALVQRGRPGDLDTAWDIANGMEHGLQAAGESEPLVPELVDLAYLRGHLGDAHALADRVPPASPPASAPVITGRVVTATGQPAAGARVIAWHGTLAGDAERASTDTIDDGIVVVTDARGAFHIAAPDGAAIVAELAGARARPVVADSAHDLVLTLTPTRAVEGHVRVDPDDTAELEARARLEVGDSEWLVRTPIARDGTFQLAGIPAGATVEIAREHHRVAAPSGAAAWPRGAIVDVIVRQPKDLFEIYVLRGKYEPRTRAQLLAIASKAADAFDAPARSVGFRSQTDVGFDAGYQPGDVHAVVRDFAPGAITACAAPSSDDAAATVTCATGELSPAGLALVLKPTHGSSREVVEPVPKVMIR